MATEKALSWREGEKVEITFTPETATDITGWTIEFTVCPAWNKPNTFQKATGGSGVVLTDAAEGEFTVTVNKEDTATRQGSYVWDAKRTDAGSEAVLAFGTLQIRPSTFAA